MILSFRHRQKAWEQAAANASGSGQTAYAHKQSEVWKQLFRDALSRGELILNVSN